MPSAFARAKDTKRRVAAGDRLVVGADQTIGKAKAAANAQHARHEFEPLLDPPRGPGERAAPE
jgi:uncharacterized NAD-dependent epimerase/dehydratase family protein